MGVKIVFQIFRYYKRTSTRGMNPESLCLISESQNLHRTRLSNRETGENQRLEGYHELLRMEGRLSGCFVKGNPVFEPIGLMEFHVELPCSVKQVIPFCDLEGLCFSVSGFHQNTSRFPLHERSARPPRVLCRGGCRGRVRNCIPYLVQQIREGGQFCHHR